MGTDTATHSSRLPASRYALQRITKECADLDFTELLRLHCTERRWERDGERWTCTFVMESKAHYLRMLTALKKHFTKIQKLYAAEGGLELYNAKTIYE